jgi:hypothetical protein
MFVFYVKKKLFVINNNMNEEYVNANPRFAEFSYVK